MKRFHYLLSVSLLFPTSFFANAESEQLGTASESDVIESMQVDSEPVSNVGEIFPGSEDEVSVEAVRGPAQRVLKGVRTLACIGIKYRNVDKVVTQEGCQYAADKMNEFYNRNSRGLLTIEAQGFAPLEVNLDGNSKNYNKAVDLAKAAHPGFNYYLIPGIYTYPHASNQVAHVKSAQVMTALHEVGHLLGLGHAGAYASVDGKTILNAYGDTDSIMGRIISRYITAPQYYYLGWLPSQEVATFNTTVPTYTLKKISEFGIQGLATVIVPPSAMTGLQQTRYAFVSVTNCEKAACLSLHLASGGGSQKVAEFSNEFYDDAFTGLHIKLISRTKDKFIVGIDFAKKP